MPTLRELFAAFRDRDDVRDWTSLAWLGPRRVTEFDSVRLIDGGETLVAEYDLVGYADARPFRVGVVTVLEARRGRIAALREYSEPSAAQVGP